MQVDLSTILAALSTAMSLAFGAWFATARYALNQREREIDRRLEECQKTSQEIDVRLHLEEKSTIRQDGELRLVQQTHEARLQNLEKHLSQLHVDLRGSSGRYSPTGVPRPEGKKPDDR